MHNSLIIGENYDLLQQINEQISRLEAMWKITLNVKNNVKKDDFVPLKGKNI